MSLWAVLLTGLFAGGASCAAVQGGLLAGTVARRRPEPAVSGSGRRKGPKKAAPASGAPTRWDDAVPVGAFLAGKLASHVVLGAGLGLAGNAMQIGPRARAYMQIAAGLVMVLLALNLLGLKAVQGLVPPPPAAWSRLVRRSGRWGHGLAPAALGVATVLIPCGVTLSMMFLAVASGSPMAGAAVMATFVVATMPLFAVIGYAARRSTAYLRGRLVLLTGAVVLVAGLVAINAGLVLNGSSFTLAGALGDLTGASQAAPVAAPPVAADGIQRIMIEAHDAGYSPSAITARAGVPTELTIRTENTRGCTRAIVMSSFGVQKVLPATGDTLVDLGSLEPGTYRYTCGMGMYSGSITAVA
ncbi:MAG TPA: sulfite exporter TauE/SafE family protein [Acidimicrobiales bacterium]|nr:sulfite exporter TauE/SafE family protein [Acidimicrobiales bacterium]